MRVDYFGKSDKGQVRKGNEDYFAIEKLGDDEFLFVVADGMGGHQAGDVASKLGTLTFVKYYKKFRKAACGIRESMDRALEQANGVILKKATDDPQKRGMGTTFSAVVLADMKAHLVHVGDSRVYLVRDEKIVKLTSDHTFVGKLVEEGRITEDEARGHPQKNILYMSLGAREAFEPETNDGLDIREGDIFAMCSDGLSNMVTDTTIKEYIQSFNARKATEELIDLANANGGTDNITLLVFRVNPNHQGSKTEPLFIVPPHHGFFTFLKDLFSGSAKKQPPTIDEEDK